MTKPIFASKLSVGRASPPAIDACKQGGEAGRGARPTVEFALMQRVSAVYRQSRVRERASENLVVRGCRKMVCRLKVRCMELAKDELIDALSLTRERVSANLV